MENKETGNGLLVNVFKEKRDKRDINLYIIGIKCHSE